VTPPDAGLARIPTRIGPDHDAMAREVAHRISALVRQRRAQGLSTVLGLATGSTPLGVYRELIRLHRDEGLDLSGVVTFNLDEYFPMDPDSLHSYHRYMAENFFDHVNIPPENVHIPRGEVHEDQVEAHCRDYEARIRKAGGIDLQLLGVGRSGHIGFNEPGSGRDSRTRLVFLDTITRRDAAADFFGEENVPLRALTMGVATILEAREIHLMVTGEHKAEIVRRTVEGEMSPDVAGTYLQDHPSATVHLDPSSAARLTRVATPWLLGEVAWTPELEVRAVIWLARTVGRSILRLETRDYRDHHLSALVARHGSAEPLNGRVFNALIAKIRGRSRLPEKKKILVFSPHPDDDVISMGGLLRKLRENGNEIVVAYQTSGNIAVFDHEVRRYLDFARRAGAVLGWGTGRSPSPRVRRTLEELEETLEGKEPAEVDPDQIQALKRIIREVEAVSALESVGLDRSRARFLDLPFYRTGRVRKAPLGTEDVERVEELLEEVEPELVFAAGDLSDPHGTHRLCLEAVRRALEAWSGPAPELWLYRGAWEEWPVHEADVLVPLSEGELRRKVLAIFKHQSQKDRAPFPGPDDREFWERVRDRNRGTADEFAALGLPAYYALEAYVVERDGERVASPTVPTGTLDQGR
jgi:glucosamine-6-phosphate deaminase